MTNDPDLSNLKPHRRNLVLLSVALCLFNAGQGRIDTLSIFGSGVSLERGEVVLYFAYLALLYFLWRYWLYATEHHHQLKESCNKELKKSSKYQSLIEDEVRKFKNEIEVPTNEDKQTEGKNPQSDPSPPWDPMRRSIHINWGRPQLQMEVENNRGDFYPDNKQVNLPIARFYILRLGAFFRSIIREKAFSELFFPYLVAILAMASFVYPFISNR